MTDNERSSKINWKKAAADSQLPVFPIRITRKGDKWDKQPLIPGWQTDASYNTDAFDWRHANGYGILMGEKSGLYALDFDDHKPGAAGWEWLRKWNVPPETRTHGTISGGTHKIYALSNKYRTLPTRANIVPGLDSRGQGGFIAFGEGYTILDNRFPCILPAAACEELIAGAGGGGGPVVLKAYRQPDDQDALMQKLQRKLQFKRLLRARWHGNNLGLVDKSGSAMDHSVARLLTMAGFEYDEVVWLLLNAFEHGSARAKGDHRVAMRAAARSVAKAEMGVEIDRQAIDGFREPPVTDEIEEAMRRLLDGA